MGFRAVRSENWTSAGKSGDARGDIDLAGGGEVTMGIIGVEAVVMGWLAVRFAVGLRGCCSGSEGVGSMDERACLHQLWQS